MPFFFGRPNTGMALHKHPARAGLADPDFGHFQMPLLPLPVQKGPYGPHLEGLLDPSVGCQDRDGDISVFHKQGSGTALVQMKCTENSKSQANKQAA